MAFVQKNTNTVYSGSALSVTLTGVAAGALLIYCLSYIQTSATPPAAPSGWSTAIAPTAVATNQAGGYFTGAAIYYKENASSGTNSPSVTLQASSWALGSLSEYSGYATSTSLDQTAPATSALTTNTTATVTSSAILQASELVIVACTPAAVTGTSNIGITDPATTGYTTLGVWQDANTYLLAGQHSYKEVSAIATQTATWTWNVADHGEYAAAIATFKQAGAAATSFPPRRAFPASILQF